MGPRPTTASPSANTTIRRTSTSVASWSTTIDLVRVGAGYPDHPHRDAEIITWVLSGSLVHEDSRGNSGLIYPGLVQRMSAGSGIVHAERNDAYRIDPTLPAEPVHFIQMWIRPDEPGVASELSATGAGAW